MSQKKAKIGIRGIPIKSSAEVAKHKKAIEESKRRIKNMEKKKGK